MGFFNFLCFKLKFWSFSFLGLPKHNRNRVPVIFMFLLLKEKKTGKRNDNWNFWSWVFGPKMAVSWRKSVLQKIPCWNPYFHSVFEGAFFFGQAVKKGKFGHPQKRKIWLITEKLVFGIFVFLCFVFVLFVFVFVFVFRFIFFVFLFFCFLFYILCFLFLFFVFCFLFSPFLSLLLIEKTCFPPKRTFLFIFECLPLFLLSFFWPPPFSIYLSLSLSCYFLSLFLLVFLLCFL